VAEPKTPPSTKEYITVKDGDIKGALLQWLLISFNLPHGYSPKDVVDNSVLNIFLFMFYTPIYLLAFPALKHIPELAFIAYLDWACPSGEVCDAFFVHGFIAAALFLCWLIYENKDLDISKLPTSYHILFSVVFIVFALPVYMGIVLAIPFIIIKVVELIVLFSGPPLFCIVVACFGIAPYINDF